VLVLLGVAGAFVLFELEFAEVGDAAHGRIRRRRDFDQVEAGFFGAVDRLLDGQNANLLPIGVEDAYFRSSNLAVGSRASGGRRSRNEWWARNRRFSLLTRSNTGNSLKCKAFQGTTHAQIGQVE
jgi:hypothetical protein